MFTVSKVNDAAIPTGVKDFLDIIYFSHLYLMLVSFCSSNYLQVPFGMVNIVTQGFIPGKIAGRIKGQVPEARTISAESKILGIWGSSVPNGTYY